MIISARYLGAVLTAAMLVGGAAAQDLPLPGLDGSLNSPDLRLPPLNDGSSSMIGPNAADAGGRMGAPDTSMNAHDGYDHFAPSQYDYLQNNPAPIESTGTWLRRGFWYAEADAVIWSREWNRNSQFYAVEDQNVNSPNFFRGVISPVFNTNRFMLLDGSQPEDASVRFTLGHFMFRDQGNRDHTVEFTANTGGDWAQDISLGSVVPFGLFVPFIVDGANRSFDGSSHQQMDYSSQYNSFELNYRVKARMGRDQIVMDPEGCWHRAANSGWTWEYLAGLRFMQMTDILDWRAQDIQQVGSDGQYLIRTANNMFGFQLGQGCTYETGRWSAGYNVKGGVFVNHAQGRTTLDFTGEGDNAQDFDLHLTNNVLAFVGEARLVGKYHLTPNLSVRAAWEMMYLTSAALAPNQATFISEFAFLDATQDPFFQGASFGLEGYW